MNNKKILFSIIIPTFNEEKFIPKLLNDIKNQKYKNFEVIIIDGLSSDKTKEVVDKFKNYFSLLVINSNKKNVAAQRNFGVKKAIGDYLIFLDADARVRKTFLNKLNYFINKNKGLLFIPYSIPDKKHYQYKPFFDIVNLLIELSQKLPRKFSLGGSIIIEKNFFNLIGGFDESLYISEDHELIQRASYWGVNVKFLKNNPVAFSLRRMEKEGQLKFLYKYFIAFTKRLLTKEEIKNKIFEYEMGGHIYNDLKKEDFITNYINKIKKLFKEFKKTIMKI